MELLREVLNNIIENWQLYSVMLFAILSTVIGAGKVAKLKTWIEEAKQVYRCAIILLSTIKKALEDKKLTKEEMEEIKKEIDDLMKEIKDLF